MAVTIVFKDKTTLKLDATLAQDHEITAEVTDHPTENGADVADHIRPKPYTLSIQAIQSYAPIVSPGSTPEANRHVAAFERLKKAVDKRETVTVQTGLHVYTDMAIEGMVVRKDSGSGVDVPLSLAFKQLRTATAKTTQVPRDAIGKASPTATEQAAARQVKRTQSQAAAKVNKGNVQKQPATPKQEELTKSILKMFLGR